MSSLLKNQILKHLSKFTKNLSSDRLNVSAIKGEGELSNLELDEEVLTDLLELPTWLKITRASCNRVAIKIQWTKLKSQPICLYLDEVVVEMETCETPRPPSSSSNKSTLSPGGKYGFIDKVMDGIFVHVNSVIVKMMSRTFSASLQLSRVKVHSTTPTWGATNDLRTTRIRDTSRGEILVFKEIEWQTTRIEAAADESLSKEALTPLRLIANQAKIRVVLKKRLSDCSIVSSRVILLLDDLLWVLTVMQLKAAILYANSLKEVIERSARQSKRLAAEKLKRQGIMTGGGAQHAQQQRTQESTSTSAAAKLFTRFDVATTSYHLVTSRFDLHLCDDTATATDSTRHWDISNGSMQITFFRLSFDFYPFHPAGGERKGWFRYTDNVGTRNPWVQKLFAAFREDAVKIRKVCGSPNPSPSTSTTKMSSVGTGVGSNNPSPTHSPSHAATPSPSRSPSHHPGQQQQRQKSTRLLESCCVIKIEDLTIYMVSTPNTKRTGHVHQKFLVSDKKQLHLPSDMSVVHMEYTEYFFPDGMDYPVPHPNLYIMVNPVKVTLDFLTLLWSQYFLFTLAQSVELDLGEQGPVEHVDIKLEALMPRVVVPSEVRVEGQPDRPDALQLQISKLIATNCRMDDKLTHNDLRKCLDHYYGSHLFHTAKFPNDSLPFRLTPWQLENHASHKDNPFLDKAVKGLLESDPNLLQCLDTGVPHILSSNSLKMDAACDVWGLHLEQVWVEFLGVQNARNRPVPCVEAFPLTLWLGITQAQVSANAEARLSVQSSNTLRSEPQRGSHSGSPLLHQRRMSQQEDYSEESRPSHIPLAETKGSRNRAGESFEDCLSLQSDELNLQQPADETAFVLPHFGAKMRMQVNHHQYLFLARLSESFSKFQEELAVDLALWGSTKSRVFHLPVRFPDAELAIVCPYQMDQRTFSDDFSPSVVNFPDVFGVPGSVGSNGGGQGVLDTTLLPEPGLGELTNQAYQTDKDGPVDNNNIIPILNRDTDPSPTPMMGDTIPTLAHATFPSDLTPSDLYNSASQPLPPSFTADPKSQMSMSAGTDSGIGLDRKSSLKGGKSKGAEMKKAFSSAFSNFTDKLKNTFDDNTSDDLDSLSLKTDTSDDEDFEQFSLDDTDEVPAFIHEGRSDAGSNPDTYSDMDTSSIYADSSTTKGREMVSVILVKLDGVEGVLQVCDTCTMLAAQVSQIQLHQPGNVGYEDFYSKFSAAKGFVQEEKVIETDSPPKFPIRFKFHLPTAPPGSATPNPPDPGALTVRVEDYSLQFKMSGITALTDFIEDEGVAQVIPMSVTVQNFLLVLDEDRPANSSSGGVPINFHIDHLYITRGTDGIFYLTSNSGGSPRSDAASPCADTDTMEARGPHSPSSISSLSLLTQTQTENAQLRRQCDELNRANKLYEEQIIIMRDKMRDYELQLVTVQQQQQQQKQQHHHHKNQPQSPRSRNHSLSSSPGCSVNELSAVSSMQAENLKLQERVTHLEDDLLTATKEKESLVSTLQFLQEELLKSERRARSNTAAY